LAQGYIVLHEDPSRTYAVFSITLFYTIIGSVNLLITSQSCCILT